MHLHYYKSLIILLNFKIFQQESIQTSSMVSKGYNYEIYWIWMWKYYSGFQYTVRVFSVVIIRCELFWSSNQGLLISFKAR